MLQKILQIGNSYGITIPKIWRRELGLRVGELVNVEKRGNRIIVGDDSKKSVSKVARGLTPEFKSWLDDIKEKHDGLIKELAKR